MALNDILIIERRPLHVQRLRSMFFPNMTEKTFSKKDYFTELLIFELKMRYAGEIGKKDIHFGTNDTWKMLKRVTEGPVKQKEHLIEAMSKFLIIDKMVLKIFDFFLNTPNDEWKQNDIEIVIIVDKYRGKQYILNCTKESNQLKEEIMRVANEKKERWSGGPDGKDSLDLFIMLSKEIYWFIKLLRKLNRPYPTEKSEKDKFLEAKKFDLLGNIFLNIREIVHEISLSIIFISCFTTKDDFIKWKKLYTATTKFFFRLWFQIRGYGHFQEVFSDKKVRSLVSVPSTAKFFLSLDLKNINENKVLPTSFRAPMNVLPTGESSLIRDMEKPPLIHEMEKPLDSFYHLFKNYRKRGKSQYNPEEKGSDTLPEVDCVLLEIDGKNSPGYDIDTVSDLKGITFPGPVIEDLD